MKLTLSKIRRGALIFALILLAGGVGWWLGSRGVKIEHGEIFSGQQKLPAGKENLDFSLFWDVWQRLEKSYLHKEALVPQKMFWGAIKGMVASLEDPYTAFLPPEENKQTKEDLNGEFGGVGIQLGYKDGRLAVIAPLKGTPADKAGIKAGDLILKIEDKETEGISLPEAVKQIRGPEGTKVKLTLLHENEDQPYEVTITRAKILVPSVELEFVKDGEGKEIAYLKLSRFGDKTNEEWLKAVGEIISKCQGEKDLKCQGMILDLRNNPGGYLSGAVFIASEFLEKGVVVQQEEASGIRETFSVNRRGKLTKINLVVLVNEGSASASEIVAGALQDYGRAKIVGVKTFGKGTIQEAQDLAEGAGLHITTARWLLPKGRSIEKDGIMPDIEVKDDLKTELDEQLEKAMQLLISN